MIESYDNEVDLEIMYDKINNISVNYDDENEINKFNNKNNRKISNKKKIIKKSKSKKNNKKSNKNKGWSKLKNYIYN